MRKIFKPRRILASLLAGAAIAAGWSEPAAAITVRLDYSTDTSTFFGSGNPQGATAGMQAKAAMDAAALFYSGILNDTFSAITAPPPKFYGSLGGEATWYTKRKFVNPTTGVSEAIFSPTALADDYVVFVGARDLPGSELGRGGPGFVSAVLSRNGAFTTEEKMQLDTMKTEFEGAVIKRGETTGFGRWGGAISFDRPTNWHFNHMTDPMGGQIDFFSVALHELAHALGLGASKEWDDLVSGTTFTGTNAKAAHTPTDQTDQPPLVSTTDTGHWSQMIATSPVFDSPATLQTPLMVPSLGSNTRRKLTRLDAAALVDLGWEINLPISGASSLVSGDAPSVSSGFAALSASVVPEPAGVVLVVMGAMFAVAFRSRARG